MPKLEEQIQDNQTVDQTNDCDSNVEPDEIVEFLKRDLKIKELYHKVLCQRIINQKAAEQNLKVTPEEIQEEADRQRYARRLEKASETLGWLTEQMITPEEWEAGIHDRLLSQKLSEHMFGKDVEKYFIEHKLDYEQVVFYQMVVPDERLAREIFYQIEEEEISFHQAAHLYDVDHGRRQRCGYEGKRYRRSFTPQLASAVFAATPGEVAGPVKTEEGYHLLLVEEFVSPELTPEREKEIMNQQFRNWLMSELNYILYNALDAPPGSQEE